MNQHIAFERVVDSLNAAMLDDARWPVASSLIDEACGSKGNFLTLSEGVSNSDTEIFRARFCYRGQRRTDLERLYLETYYPLDERIPRIRQLPDSQVKHVGSLYTDEEKKCSPVYNEALPLSDTQDSLNVRLDGPDGTRIIWVVGNPFDGDGWSSAGVDMVARVLPHLRQYVRVRAALAEAGALAATAAELLENTGAGVIQLDRRRRIVETNDVARALLRRSDGLRDEGGALRATQPEDDARLEDLLARALPRFGQPGASGSMMVRRRSSLPWLAVHVKPVSGGEADYRALRVAALVLIVDPVSRGRVEPELLEAMLGLTPTEAEIALLLAEGWTARQIEAMTGRSYSTVRTHLKNIFAKLRVSRQLEVAKAVLALSSLPTSRD